MLLFGRWRDSSETQAGVSLHRVQSKASVLPQELLGVVLQVIGMNVNSTGRWQ